MNASFEPNWLESLAYLYGIPRSFAGFKQSPEDFYVKEQLGFEVSNNPQGQHHWLCIQKTNLNTAEVVQILSRFAGVHPRQIGYSGLKDKHAITEQWFSVELPVKKQLSWKELEYEQLKIIDWIPSTKKLKRGIHEANQFKITLKGVEDPEWVLKRIELLKAGVPNYFGPQRFGYDNSNLKRALQLFEGRKISNRNQRGLAISAARSYVFNSYVSARIEAFGQEILAGDCMNLTGSNSFFVAEPNDPELQNRLMAQDISPTGPLIGQGELLVQDQAQAFERKFLEGFQAWQESLINEKLQLGRRAIWLYPRKLKVWQVSDDCLVLSFELPTGSYATSVLRELIRFNL